MAGAKKKTAIAITAAILLAIVFAPGIARRLSPLSCKQELSDDEVGQYKSWTGTTPAEVANAVFQDCASQDWAGLSNYWEPDSRYPLGERFKTYYGGLRTFRLDQPFVARVRAFGNVKYGGVFVPYRVTLRNGETVDGRLAIRCDNPERHWYLDGGL